MKRNACVLLALLLLLPSVLLGCGRIECYREQFYLMDTLIGVTLYTDDSNLAEEAFDECERILTELDGLWARRVPTSEIARFNASTGGLESLDARTYELLRTALAVSEVTDGTFDITVTPLIELWELCGEDNRLPEKAELTAAQSAVGYRALQPDGTGLRKNDSAVALDLGGIGKGMAISHLIAYLETTDLLGGLVTFGSNVAVFGEKPDGSIFRVAIKHPRKEESVIGELRLAPGEVLSVSGDYERYETIGGKKYHHILDPQTGYPADTGLASVAVVAHDGAWADALSTALFVMGIERAMALYRSEVCDFEAIFVDVGGNVTVTDGLADRFVKED